MGFDMNLFQKGEKTMYFTRKTPIGEVQIEFYKDEVRVEGDIELEGITYGIVYYFLHRKNLEFKSYSLNKRNGEIISEWEYLPLSWKGKVESIFLDAIKRTNTVTAMMCDLYF